jgi:hypothetical protein
MFGLHINGFDIFILATSVGLGLGMTGTYVRQRRHRGA